MGVPPRAFRLGAVLAIAGGAIAASASADPRPTLFEAGTALSFHRPTGFEGTITTEFDLVTSSTIDLSVVGHPHERVGIAGEFGFGHSWDGGLTTTEPRGFEEPLVCTAERQDRDYFRINGAVILDITTGTTRPFVVAGGGLWGFLERETRNTYTCSNNEEGVNDVLTLSSAEDPVFLFGGGVRFREGSRFGFRTDYRGYVVFEDNARVLVNQFRAALQFRPHPTRRK